MTIRDIMKWNRPFNIPVSHREQLNRNSVSLQDEIERLFDDFIFSNFAELYGSSMHNVMLAVDLVENDKSFTIKAELAGIDPEDVEISVTDGFLTIKGEKKEDKTEQKQNENEDKDATENRNQHYLRREVSYGAFQRTIALPEAADMDKAEASFKNGILTVEVPKKAEAQQKPKRLQINRAA